MKDMTSKAASTTRHGEDDKFAGKACGWTVGDLRSALRDLPDGMEITIRCENEDGDQVFCGGILEASPEDNCGGLHFAIECSDDAALLEASREDVDAAVPPTGIAGDPDDAPSIQCRYCGSPVKQTVTDHGGCAASGVDCDMQPCGPSLKQQREMACE